MKVFFQYKIQLDDKHAAMLETLKLQSTSKNYSTIVSSAIKFAYEHRA